MSKKEKPKRGEQAAYSLAKRGLRALERGDYRAALTDLETAYDPALKKSSLPEKIQQALAEVYFRRGQRFLFEDTAQAQADLQRAAELQPHDALYAHHVGLVCHRFGDTDKAITWYEEALRRDPAFDRARLPLALAYLERGDDLAGTSLWQSLDDNQQALLGRRAAGTPLSQGLAHAAAGDWPAARTALQDAVDGEQALLARGLAHYYLGTAAARVDDTEGALRHWRAARDAGLSSPHLAHNLALGCTRQAHAALAAGQSDRAVEWVQVGRSLDDDQPLLDGIETGVRLAAGYACARQGRWQRALDHWQGIEDPPPGQARALAANIAIGCEKLERWQMAAEAWRDFARRRPRKETSVGWLSEDQVAQLWARVALLYHKAGEIGEAIQTLQNALKYQPDDPVLLLELARYFLAQDSFDAAENRIDKVLKKHPQHAGALVLKAELAELSPGWFGKVPGMKEWEKVAALEDEANAPLARQRLGTLYSMKALEQLKWGSYKAAEKMARRGLAHAPEKSVLRELLFRSLLMQEADWALIEAEIEPGDLADHDVLHWLVDGMHFAGYDDRVEALLDRADAIRPLDAAFFIDVAIHAYEQEKEDIAENYLAEALERAATDEERRRVRVELGELYMFQGQRERAEAIWEEVRREDPAFGPVLYTQGMLAFTRAELFIAGRLLKKAAAWAREHDDSVLLDKVQASEEMIRHSDLYDDFDEDWEE